jgi:molybdopterin converting factor small subunit
MSTLVRIAPILQEHLQMPETVSVEGDTLGQCLDDLSSRYPPIREFLYHPQDLLRVLVTIDNKEILALNIQENRKRILNPDDEIQILALAAEG